MHATQLHGGTSPPSTPIGLALGEHAAPTIDAAIEAVTGVAWLLEFEGEIVVATAESDAQRQARIGARIVAEIVHQRGGQVTIVTPPRSVVGSLPLLGDRSGWAEADASGRGARLDRIPVWRELTEAAGLIGVATIGDAAAIGPLAIGLWRRFVHPRLAMPARLGGHRSPLAADLAIPFQPRLLVLIGRWRRLIVAVATPDLIAAELAGLAIRHGATGDPGNRPRPWEDPLVQRATELGLGVLHPAAIDLRLVWSGPGKSPAADPLGPLANLVADALGISQSAAGRNTMVSDGGQP